MAAELHEDEIQFLFLYDMLTGRDYSITGEHRLRLYFEGMECF